MLNLLSRSVWFLLSAALVSYASYLVVGSAIYSQQKNEIITTQFLDRISANKHELTGAVVVHRTCEQIKAAITLTPENVYVLQLTTWEEPSVECIDDPVSRLVKASVFAPAVGVSFIATLDGAPFPIRLRQEIAP